MGIKDYLKEKEKPILSGLKELCKDTKYSYNEIMADLKEYNISLSEDKVYDKDGDIYQYKAIYKGRLHEFYAYNIEVFLSHIANLLD